MRYPFRAGHHFLDRLTGEFHVQRIGAKLNVIVPGNGPVGGYAHCLETARLVPCLEDPLASQARQINLAALTVVVLYQNPVSGQRSYFHWLMVQGYGFPPARE